MSFESRLKGFQFGILLGQLRTLNSCELLRFNLRNQMSRYGQSNVGFQPNKLIFKSEQLRPTSDLILLFTKYSFKNAEKVFF